MDYEMQCRVSGINTTDFEEGRGVDISPVFSTVSIQKSEDSVKTHILSSRTKFHTSN